MPGDGNKFKIQRGRNAGEPASYDDRVFCEVYSESKCNDYPDISIFVANDFMAGTLFPKVLSRHDPRAIQLMWSMIWTRWHIRSILI